MKKIKLGIVDDYEPLRTSVSNTLNAQKDFEVILQASNGQELLDMLENSQPDIILLDIQMPVMGGIEASEKIKERFPKVIVIAFSQYASESNIIDMYINGVKSFIEKTEGISELLRAIRIVSDGGFYTTNQVAEIIQRNLYNRKAQKVLILGTEEKQQQDIQSKLSASEIQILRLIGNRLTMKEIAQKLFLSPNTINNKQANLRKKLKLNGRGKLLAFALSIRKYLEKIENQVENR
jgi:DNA-binding NarL/FixJ family response regulator